MHPIILCLFMAIAAAGAAKADSVADFYRGKTLQIIVGYGTGGGYDLYARVVGRHIGKHIPGNPGATVQNMPGAGSLRAANHVYNVSPKDGTVIGTFARTIPLMGLLGGNPNVRFDARQFTWLGSPTSGQDDAYFLLVRRDARVKSLEEAMKAGGPELVLGGTAEGSTDTAVALLIRRTVGVNLKVIGGYPDGNAMNLAIERGELEGRFLGLSATMSTKPEWLGPGGLVQPLLQFARAKRHPDFPNVPTAREIARSEQGRLLIELAEIPHLLSRPFVAPPDLPPDRAKALQAAFRALGQDEAFITEAKKVGLDVSPVGAEEAITMLNMFMNAPQELKEELRKLVGSAP